ncbi:metallophosphoesterase family protein [candidate division KSB1 bacterium]|nr:metallophosphoesterase family protein [candidate division KSB1 bacterium]
MRYAIISDIHSNLEALTSVLEQIEKEQVDKTYCLGDIVGYGPNPNECIELIRKNCDMILTGNHDYACVEPSELVYFNRFATQAVNWTIDQITKENLRFLSNFTFKKILNNIIYTHANPHTPETWEYILSIDEAIFNFSQFTEHICFIGHSHQPITYIEDEKQKYTFDEEREIALQPNCRYIINVGSVGQPRDNNPASAFGVFDTSTETYELIRTGYNVEKTHKKMIEAGLPEFLADRLLTGR